MPPGFTPAAGWQPDPSWPQAPAGWQYWIADTSSDMTMTPFYGGQQPSAAGDGMALGIPGLILGVVGLIVVVILQGIIWASSHGHLTYSASMLTTEKVLCWIAAVALLAGTVLGAAGVRKPRGGGVALAALIICGLSGAIFSVPVF